MLDYTRPGVKSLRQTYRRSSYARAGRSVRTSRVRPDRFSWLIFGGSATIGFSAAREDALRRVRACACEPAAATSASVVACVCARVCARVSWVWGQRLSGVIESCLQGAALRCSSQALPPGEGNHNAI